MNPRTIRSPLALSDIDDFFSAKIPGGPRCPCCGSNQWKYAREDVDGETLGLSVMQKEGTVGGLYATIVMTCDNCGFMSLHAKTAIVNWLNNRDNG